MTDTLTTAKTKDDKSSNLVVVISLVAMGISLLSLVITLLMATSFDGQFPVNNYYQSDTSGYGDDNGRYGNIINGTPYYDPADVNPPVCPRSQPRKATKSELKMPPCLPVTSLKPPTRMPTRPYAPTTLAPSPPG